MKTPTEVDALLSSYPPQVQKLAHQLRRLVTDATPGANEMVDPSARLIGYGQGSGYKGLAFTIIPSQRGVKLGIVRGIELPDPHHLLEGSGKVHRHVAFSRLEDFERPGLEPLVESAIAEWRERVRLGRET